MVKKDVLEKTFLDGLLAKLELLKSQINKIPKDRMMHNKDKENISNLMISLENIIRKNL